MATIIEPSKGKAPQLDDGLYTVICRGVKGVTAEQDQYGNYEKIEIALEVEGQRDEEGDPVFLDPRCNRKWNEKSTLFQWAQAFGVVASTSEAFDADELIGKRAQALIETPEEGSWPRITKMTALKKRSGTAPAPATTPAMINPDGSFNYDVFWKAVGANGITREQVAEAVNGDLNNLSDMEPTALVTLFEYLKEQVLPF